MVSRQLYLPFSPSETVYAYIGILVNTTLFGVKVIEGSTGTSTETKMDIFILKD